MSCRIQIAKHADGSTVVVAGRLEDAHLPDLVRLCSESTQPVTLDLTELQSADRIAVDALRRLRQDGITLVGIPTYLQFTLDDLD